MAKPNDKKGEPEEGEKIEEPLWETQGDSEWIVSEMLELVVQKGAEMLYEHYLEDKSIPHSMDWLAHTFKNSVDTYFLDQDPGENLDNWVENPEPVRSRIDAWGRGAIQVKRRTKYDPVQENPSEYLASRKPTKSYASSIRGGKARIPKKTLDTSVAELPQPVGIKVEETPEIDENELQLRKYKEMELQRKRDETQQKKQREEQEIEEKRKNAKIASDLKKKDFTYDNQGNLLIITKVNPDKLPRDSYTVKYDFTAGGDIAKEPTRSFGNRSTTSKTSSKKISQTPKLSHERKLMQTLAYREEERNEDARGTSFEVFQPADGVKMSEDGKTKEGSMIQRIDSRMTRKEYRTMTEDQALKKKWDDEKRQKKAEKEKEKLPPIKKATNPNMAAVTASTMMGGRSIQLKNEELLKKMNEMASATYTTYQGDRSQLSGLGGGLGGTSWMSSDRVKRFSDQNNVDPNDPNTSEVDKFNMELSKNPNWGSERASGRVAELPKKPRRKPGFKEQHRALGAMKKLPRDRTNVEKKGPRRHMAAPPLGKTMGHGIIHEGIEPGDDYFANTATERTHNMSVTASLNASAIN
eukprot:CAMPEP_0115017218 /NCGR_PEP_ID=MMETSP0216-20121206/27964_1 /TAXON_ID=223996 /ORGANISM="Protocruzia adherens, Strain Boccale" /LENGTH=580 /DNA_ID=CAMNT_0002387949 /DNA_START=39 /DNA_END=1781 /DNA_ORIENTATION=+